jgi:predicted acyltransferase (DUF342 family)
MIASKEIPFYPLMANNNNLHGTLLDANSKIFYTSYVDADFILNKGAFIGESVCIYLNNELTVTQKWNELFQYTSGIQKWARSASDMVTDVKDVKIEQVFFTSDIIVIRTSDNSLTGINIYDGKNICLFVRKIFRDRHRVRSDST